MMDAAELMVLTITVVIPLQYQPSAQQKKLKLFHISSAICPSKSVLETSWNKQADRKAA